MPCPSVAAASAASTVLQMSLGETVTATFLSRPKRHSGDASMLVEPMTA
jgi:hypothetical protein